jgi:putative component of membrane protein insertase Oxa1/YidC/SpoIIIJ protein YidD
MIGGMFTNATPSVISGFGSRLAVGLIEIYQRFISPYKGFRCAYRVHHGGLSCSEFGRQVVQTHGVFRAMSMIRVRFCECAEAARILRFAAADATDPPGEKESGPVMPCSGEVCCIPLDACSCFY